MVTRNCVICGKAFECYPSDITVTCSNACRRERQRRIQTGHSISWSDEAKARLSEKGQTANLKLGTAAAQTSPIAGRGEENQEAKVWILVTPDGEEIVVRNLLHWARSHTDLFDKPPGDQSAKQIAAGFKAIAQTLRGGRKSGKQRGAYTYKGWTLKGLPQSLDSPTAEIPADKPKAEEPPAKSPKTKRPRNPVELSGINYYPRRHKWQLTYNGKYIGLFATQAEAVAKKRHLQGVDQDISNLQPSLTGPQSSLAGVTYQQSSNKWRVTHDGKYIGLFDTQGQAEAVKRKLLPRPISPVTGVSYKPKAGKWMVYYDKKYRGFYRTQQEAEAKVQKLAAEDYDPDNPHSLIQGVHYNKKSGKWWVSHGGKYVATFSDQTDAEALSCRLLAGEEVPDLHVRRRDLPQSPIPGVSYHPRMQKWMVRHKGKYIGSYQTQAEAEDVKSQLLESKIERETEG